MLILATQAQNDKFNNESSFSADLQSLYARNPNPVTRKSAEDFETVMQSLPAETKTKLYQICRDSYKSGLPPSPHIETFLGMVYAAIGVRKVSPEQLTQLLAISHNTIKDYTVRKDLILQYFTAMQDFFKEGYLYNSKFNQYKIANNTPFTIGYVKPAQKEVIKEPTRKQPTEEEFAKEAENTKNPVEEDFGWGTEAPAPVETDPFKVQEIKNDNGGWDSDNPWGDSSTTTDTIAVEKPSNYIEEFTPLKCITPFNDTLKVEGPFIMIEKTNLTIFSAYDTVTISQVEGKFIPLKTTFNAKGGTVTWAKVGLPDVFCELSDYSISMKLPAIKDNSAKMTYKSKTDSTVIGIFEYKAAKNNSKPFAEYPKFMSHYGGIEVKNVAKDINYKGGFSLIGKRFSSLNYCGEPSQVEVFRNGKLKFRANSRQEYLFADSLLQNQQASMTVFMTDTATISHPGVKLRYMFGTGDLTARKEKREYRYTPFYDSYHKVEIQADFLKWNVATDSMQLSILNAKKQIPAEIRSVDFYNEVEMAELQRLQKYHPLLILNGYLMREPKNVRDRELREYERKSMNIYLQDLANYSNVGLKSLQGVMLDMHRLGLVEYDSRKSKYDEKTRTDGFGHIKLLRKGKLFIDAHKKKSDYDKVWLKSFRPDGKNMNLNMTSNEMTVSGVPFFYLKKVDGDQREERTEMVEQKAQRAMQDSLNKMPQADRDTLTNAGKDQIAEVFREIERRKIDLMDVTVWDTLKPQQGEDAMAGVPKEVIAEIVVEDPGVQFLKGKEKKDYIAKKEAEKKQKAQMREKAIAKADSINKAKPKAQDFRKIKSKQVIIKENREMEFNAHPLAAENYGRFYGKSFTFNYKDYFVRMPATDSLIFEGADNGIKVTSGTFYLGHPNNKSSNKSVPEYPKFEAEVGGYVDFKSQKILDGAYDSLVKFELEPFTLDSMASTNPENENLMGLFESNGIFPNFRDTLKLGKYDDVSLDPKEQEKIRRSKKQAKSFGFTHWKGENKEYPNGYPLYRKKNAVFEGDIKLLGNNGIRGDGEIRYLTAKLYSNDFIYYEDSVVTFGKKSSQKVVSNGTIRDTLQTYGGDAVTAGTTYPDVSMKWFGMQWKFERDSKDKTQIVSDSMLLRSNEGLPFDMYYRHPNPEQRGKYQGTLALTDRQLTGAGQFDNVNSTAESKEFKFENIRYNAGHAFFVIKRPQTAASNPDEKKDFASRNNAVEATNVRVNYEFDEGLSEDEQTGHAVIETEVKGQQSFSFPDAKYKTSLGKADWFFAYKRMTMSMPEGSDLSSSVFSSTHLSPAENISFNGSNAIYDLESYKLTVSGVPYIYSMYARVIPFNNDVTIEKGAKMEPLKEAIVELLSNKTANDTVVHHTLYNASVVVHSKNKFTGSGTHKYKNDAGEEFNILFNNFEAQPRNFQDKNKKGDDSLKIVYAKTKIVEKDKFMKQAGVQFRGDVELRADSVNLIFTGEIKFVDEPNSAWFPLGSSGGAIAVAGTEKVDGKEYGTGIFLNEDTKSLKTLFKSEMEKDDKAIFMANGVFRKDVANNTLVIEPIERQRPDLYKKHLGYTGNNFVYSSKTNLANFDGEFDLIHTKGNGFSVRTVGIGHAEFTKKKYDINMMIVLDIPEIKGNAFKKMGDDIAKFIKNTSPKHLPRPNDSIFYKISHFITTDKLEDYIKDVNRGKQEYSDYLPTALTLTHVNMHWSESHKAFYSKGKIGLGNIFKEETNIWVDGYVEIPFDPQNPKNQQINIYLELGKNRWYFFTQRGNDLKVLASDVAPQEGTNDYGNPEFNTEVSSSKSKDKFKIADATEKARFKSSFRQNYLGDSTPEPEPEKPKKDEDKTIIDEEKKDGDKDGDGK
jgi:hypothetical protein